MIAACTLTAESIGTGDEEVKAGAAGVRGPINKWQFAAIDVVRYSVWGRKGIRNLLKD